MGKKARKHTPEPLPLHDGRWIPLEAAIELRKKETGDLGEAVLGLERDKQQCILRQKRATGEREPVPAPFGEAYAIDISAWPSGGITVYRRTAIDNTQQRWGMFAHQAADRIDDLFYCWRPDLEGQYSGNAPDDKEPPEPIDRATAALRALYRSKAEMPRTLKAIHKAVDEYCEQRGWQPVESEMVNLAAVKLGYRDTGEPDGAPRKFTPEQQQWLQDKYSSDLMANPLLKPDGEAVHHVTKLAKDKYGVEVGRTTLLGQIIRPVRRAVKNRQ